jgi:hypothetical protein
MKILLERSGGFTGIPLKTSIDTDLLGAVERDRLHAEIEAVDFFHLPTRMRATHAGADRFQYTLTIIDGRRKRTVEVSEPGIPDELLNLFQHIRRLERPGNRE